MLFARRTRQMLVVLFAILFVGASSRADEATTKWIDGINEGLLSSGTLKAEVILETRDHQGEGRRVVFNLLRRSDEKVIRTLIEVTSPESAVGTLYEIIAVKGRLPERWTYAPALGRLRKLVGFQWTDSFLGTEFTFEDLELTHPIERARGSSESVVRDGKNVVEVSSAPYAAYSKVVTQINADTRRPVGIQFFDSAGVLWKTLDYEWVIDPDHPLPDRIVLNDVQTRARSTLTFRDVETGFDLPWSRFSESEIRRRLDGKNPS